MKAHQHLLPCAYASSDADSFAGARADPWIARNPNQHLFRWHEQASKTYKAICSADDVAQDGQPTISGLRIQWHVALMGAVGAAEKLQPAVFKRLQFVHFKPRDPIIDAV